MTMHAPINRTSEDELWAEAYRAINEWRGTCMYHFARAECAVTETLVALRDVADRGQSVPLKEVMGHRFQDLAQLLAPGGDFAAEGIAVSTILHDFMRIHERLRSDLAHGSSRISLERGKHWVVTFQCVAIRKGQPDRSQHSYFEADAGPLLQSLQISSQNLCRELKLLRQSLGA
jgi:hypothetical protein